MKTLNHIYIYMKIYTQLLLPLMSYDTQNNTQQQNSVIKSWSREEYIISFLHYLDEMSHAQYKQDLNMTRQPMNLLNANEQ